MIAVNFAGLVAAAVAVGAGAPVSRGLTYTDNVLRCASALAGRVAVTDMHDMHGRSGAEVVDCLMVQDLNTLVERIDGPYGVSVKAHFVVIAKIGSPLLQHPSEEMGIGSLLVNRGVGQVPSLPIRPPELDAIRATVRNDVRTPELQRRSLTAHLGRYSLGPGVERIVGVLSGGRNSVRVFVGRLDKGAFSLLWDSPLVSGGAGFELRDLDGDGVAEMLFYDSVGPHNRALTILSARGGEMVSRDCLAIPGRACVMIIAENSYFSKRPDGSLDLVASPDSGEVYRLRRRRYSRVPPGTPVPPQTEP